MAVAINPIRLSGLWTLGYALDVHVRKSVPIGEDVYGNMRFENTRSEIGELLYQFKYNRRYDRLDEIVDAMVQFLDHCPDMENIETILPVPPSKVRYDYQPTFEIAYALAKRRNIAYCNNVLINTSHVEYKGLPSDEKQKLGGRIVKQRMANRKHNTLLIDDLYQSGATLNECVRALREDPLIDQIYVLTVTKTRT